MPFTSPDVENRVVARKPLEGQRKNLFDVLRVGTLGETVLPPAGVLFPRVGAVVSHGHDFAGAFFLGDVDVGAFLTVRTVGVIELSVTTGFARFARFGAAARADSCATDDSTTDGRTTAAFERDGATAAFERDGVPVAFERDAGDGVVRIDRVVRVGGANPRRGARKRPV